MSLDVVKCRAYGDTIPGPLPGVGPSELQKTAAAASNFYTAFERAQGDRRSAGYCILPLGHVLQNITAI